jgi:hypothetical protein
MRFYKHFKVSIDILIGCLSLVRHSWILNVKTIDVSQQRVLFRDKIKCSWIDQATKLLAMKALYNIYNVPGV